MFRYVQVDVMYELVVSGASIAGANKNTWSRDEAVHRTTKQPRVLLLGGGGTTTATGFLDARDSCTALESHGGHGDDGDGGDVGDGGDGHGNVYLLRIWRRTYRTGQDTSSDQRSGGCSVSRRVSRAGRWAAPWP